MLTEYGIQIAPRTYRKARRRPPSARDVAFCTIDRIMRRLGLNGVVKGRNQRTTIPAKDGIRAADRLNRDRAEPGVGR
ncbi:hypothetical protein AB0A63_17400 [Lentzea sp. NPDC042327]|uniref:hypothetical protein n=1 Tax=Lentzea sp. NPDC042327 TaxID=3154801 RepID=UPI0033ECC820